MKHCVGVIILPANIRHNGWSTIEYMLFTETALPSPW
jgi:hypothetical protein